VSDDNVLPHPTAGRETGPDDPAAAGAGAPSKGGGGGGGGGKRDKHIDWGKFNHLIENFALIYGTDTVWDGSTRTIMKVSAMAHALGADYVKMWKGAEGRRTVLQTDVVFDPTESCDADRCVNLFGGIVLEPTTLQEDALSKAVAPMMKLVRYLTSRAADTEDECDAIMHWLLCWLAYPLQHLGTKLRSAVVMHGDEGAGKNFLFELMLDIYGEYGALVGQDELEDKFNDWRSRKMMVVGDEVSSRMELVHNKNRLKALITSPKVQINPKNLPRREEANFINIGFLSNELQPLVLDNTDRRYLVIYTPPPMAVDEYKVLGRWRSEGGAAAWYQYLLDYPLGEFNHYAPAPLTKAKEDLIDLNRSTAERFWIEWEAGRLDLPYWSCSVAQAYRAYGAYCRRTGERFPDKQGLFTRRVLRIAEQREKYLRERVMKVEQDDGEMDADAGKRHQKATRMVLVVEPPESGLGAWATDCQRAFEQPLRRYCGGPPSPEQSNTGQGND
jgi:putative DNA primase/helicase